ncbi:unnamed protein product [Lathyrus sativus]|nr:unnamed protein product [Lathyrus sativus]
MGPLIVCDQEDDILDGTPYLVSVQTDSVAEGLICNQDDHQGLECNQEDEGLGCNQKHVGDSEDDSILNVNFEDFGEDSIGIAKEIVVDKDEGKGKMKDKLKGKGNGKGKDKGKGNRKGKSKLGRPKKQRGLSDIEEYDNDELPHDYDSEDDEILKDDFPSFKLPKIMDDYKWELGTYFATREDFKKAVKTYAIHSGRNLKFKKNDNMRM